MPVKVSLRVPFFGWLSPTGLSFKWISTIFRNISGIFELGKQQICPTHSFEHWASEGDGTTVETPGTQIIPGGKEQTPPRFMHSPCLTHLGQYLLPKSFHVNSTGQEVLFSKYWRTRAS
ncbi:hypothetical protein HNY73_016187 [Argiope bruennichi]|uniref:Uncharacterized protein n=1 Tax=Argiope bruennichi TaxID=94029 RepID=A0A8T0EI19_ARGBR|nr:hypothetical protein HNY73_016187 [Argiope bruennichi]